MNFIVGMGLLLVAFLALVLIFAIPAGWMFMLLVGALHSEFGWFPRTIGLWPAVGIMFTAMFVSRSLFGQTKAEVTS